MIFKVCKTCGNTFSIDLFTKVKKNADGHSGSCKEKKNKKKQATPEKQHERYLRWKEKNPAKSKEYYLKIKDNPEYKQKQYANTKKFRENNPGWMAAQCAKRRSIKLQATVSWDEELTEFLSEEAHHLRGLRDNATKIVWNVDHIVPLQGNTVCGLHVWNNFQVIPASLNISKGNRHGRTYQWSEHFN